MIKLNQIRVTEEMILQNGPMILIEIRPIAEYVDGKKTDRILGYAYNCVAPSNKYAQFTIKVNQKKPVLTNEELENLGGSTEIQATDFEGKFYQNSNKDVLFTATASAIEVLKL